MHNKYCASQKDSAAFKFVHLPVYQSHSGTVSTILVCLISN